MGKQVELIMVTSENNNKYYRMIENSNGTWTARWGRVGVTESVKEYSMSQWQSKYNEKVRKGYKDVTSLRIETVSKGFKDITDSKIKGFLDTLQKYSRQSIAENYTISSEAVTQAQIDKAQNVLNDLSSMSQKRFSNSEADELLKDLYMTIPRRMKKVQDFLLNGDQESKKKLMAIIDREQDSIDNMASQVTLAGQNKTNKVMTLEEALGISISHVKDEEVETIKKLMGKNAYQFAQAFVVVNNKTQELFEKQKEESYKPWTKLLWHGSRNENWLSILNKGLMIRPTGVSYIGAMFGLGIYLADKAGKSIGYTSLSGSYWVNGSSSQAFLALYEANTGMEYRTKKHDSWMRNLNKKKLKELGNYDSVFAEGGIDLKNNEFIFYNECQCTIRYIVEIKK